MMTTREIKQAMKLLADHTDRTETIILDTGGQALTAHWLDGGQRLFYTLDAVRLHVEKNPKISC